MDCAGQPDPIFDPSPCLGSFNASSSGFLVRREKRLVFGNHNIIPNSAFRLFEVTVVSAIAFCGRLIACMLFKGKQRHCSDDVTWIGRKMNFSHFGERLQGRFARSSARLFFRRPFAIKVRVPLISFTFDDFPRSALHTGGAILNSFGLAGTYYASLGLMGKQATSGTMFLPEDLPALLKQGHELGCHTFGHCHSWNTKPDLFEKSIIENQLAIEEHIPGVSFRTFSYPISPPRPYTKRRAARHFVCCRGGGQTFNAGITDLNYLAAYFLEKGRDNAEIVETLINQNKGALGWLILVTHDVCKDPTPFGCTPDYFEYVVKYSVNSGARILPVVRTWEALCAAA
jgi:peptidoglycan/xylan/chitin deacetylase (PgdA/CDA1 family)